MLVPRDEEAIHRGLGLLTAIVTFVVSLLILPDFDASQAGFQLEVDKRGSRRSASASTWASTASRCGWCC